MPGMEIDTSGAHDDGDILFSEKERLESLFSWRAKGLRASEIRELLKLTQKPDIISFAGGLPNPITFPYEELQEIIIDVIKNHGKLAFQYGTTEGLVPLRQELAKWMNERFKTNLDESNILIISGSHQGLLIASYIFLNSNDTVITSNPTYLGGIGAFRAFRALMETIPLDSDGMMVDNLEDALIRLERKKIKPKFIYLIPTFQNPTGITLNAPRRKRVMDLAEAHDLLVLSDNPYSELRYKGEPLKPLITLDEKRKREIYLGTFSKILVPGLHIA